MSECRVVDLKELGVSIEVFDKIYSMGEEDGKADAEAEHKAMCESCIHKVSADDIEAIKNSAIDECIEVIEAYTYDCSIIEKLEKLKGSKE